MGMSPQAKTLSDFLAAPEGAKLLPRMNGRNGQPGWETDLNTHKYVMPELQRAFLEWWVTPKHEREPSTIREWAQNHDVNEATTRKWRAHPLFKEALDRRLAELNVSTDRVQEIYDTLWKRATDTQGGVASNKAAELYLQQVDRLQPRRVVVEDRGVETMSDEELADELERRAGETRKGLRGVS